MLSQNQKGLAGSIKALDPTAVSASILSLSGFIMFLSFLDRAYPAVGQLGRWAYMNPMKTIAIMLLQAANVLTAFAADDPREVQKDDIREAVFRYQIENARPNQKEKVEVYFFAVADRDTRDDYPGPLPLGDKRHDPSDNLMVRFKSHKPPILKNSALRHRSPDDPRRSVRFRATRIKWISDSEAEVDGGHDDASSATWTTFTVRKQNGKWKVTHAELKRAVIA